MEKRLIRDWNLDRIHLVHNWRITKDSQLAQRHWYNLKFTEMKHALNLWKLSNLSISTFMSANASGKHFGKMMDHHFVFIGLSFFKFEWFFRSKTFQLNYESFWNMFPVYKSCMTLLITWLNVKSTASVVTNRQKCTKKYKVHCYLWVNYCASYGDTIYECIEYVPPTKIWTSG